MSGRPTGPATRGTSAQTASGTSRIRAGGIARDVCFAQAAVEVQGDIDSAYHAKYDRYGPSIVGSVTGPGAHPVTVRLIPRPGKED